MGIMMKYIRYRCDCLSIFDYSAGVSYSGIFSVGAIVSARAMFLLQVPLKLGAMPLSLDIEMFLPVLCWYR